MVLLVIFLILLQPLAIFLFDSIMMLESKVLDNYPLIAAIIALVVEGIAYYFLIDIFFNLMGR